MLYEIINPSDPCTFMSDDVVVAGIVVVLLGSGQYSANVIEDGAPANHPDNVPFFIFGGFEEWLEEKTAGKSTPQSAVGDYASAVIAALRTVCYGSASQRKLYDLALEAISDPGARDIFIEKWNDETRSSLNNIMGRAHLLAKNLEEKYTS